jgi:hypothetical protein
MLAGFAPNRQPDAGGGSVAERHRRAAAPGLWGPERNDAVAPRLVEISPQDQSRHFVLEADNSPVPKPAPAPRKADNCGHCGKPLATLRSAASRYCDRYCSKSAFPGYPRCCCARTIRATTYMKARECRLNRHFPIPASANAIVWCKNIHSSNFPLDRRQVLPKL